MLKEEIKQIAATIHSKVIENRRYLHAHAGIIFQ
jgi:hypothetical protein